MIYIYINHISYIDTYHKKKYIYTPYIKHILYKPEKSPKKICFPPSPFVAPRWGRLKLYSCQLCQAAS